MESIKIRNNGNRQEILDIVRGKYVALTPEEWVRQQVIHHLHHTLDYPLELMLVEGAITLNGMTRRCDIVIYDRSTRPVLVVECKKSTLPLTQKVLDQVCRYNLVLQVPYLLLTNGHQQICCHLNTATRCLEYLPQLPKWSELG